MKNYETALIASMLSNNGIIFEVDALVNRHDFESQELGDIFSQIIDLKRNSSDINTTTLEGSPSLIAKLFLEAISSKSWKSYADKVLELSKLRRLKHLALEIGDSKESSVELIDYIMQEVLEISRNTREETDIKSIIKNLEKYQEENIKHLESGKQYIGLETGIEILDKMTDGIQKSTLWLINAYTSIGKTFFALNLIISALRQNKRVVLIALEMGKESLVARLLGIMGKLNSLSIIKGYHIADEKEMLAKAQLYEKDLTIHKKKRYLHEIMQVMNYEHCKKPVDLIVIDYLQHIKTKDAKSRYDRYSDASNDIQDFVDRTGVPVLLLSQIDNASARSGNSEVIATKGSGDVPADADVVMLLQHDKERQQCYQENIKAINCIIQKQRNGMTGKLDLIMDTKNGIFSDAKNYGQ